MIHTLRIGFLYNLMVLMILMIAEIKMIKRSQLEALDIKKKENKNKKALSILCSNLFSGRWDMVVGLGGISDNKQPGLASSVAAPCRQCLYFCFYHNRVLTV